MKQRVNAYSTNRVLAELAGITIDLKTLALWTILSLRWPLLSRYLERNPGAVR